MREIFSNIKQVACIYTVEILPPTSKSSVMAFKYGDNGGPRVPVPAEVSSKNDTSFGRSLFRNKNVFTIIFNQTNTSLSLTPRSLEK